MCHPRHSRLASTRLREMEKIYCSKNLKLSSRKELECVYHVVWRVLSIRDCNSSYNACAAIRALAVCACTQVCKLCEDVVRPCYSCITLVHISEVENPVGKNRSPEMLLSLKASFPCPWEKQNRNSMVHIFCLSFAQRVLIARSLLFALFIGPTLHCIVTLPGL